MVFEVLYPWHLYVWMDLYNSGKIDYTYDYFWTRVYKTLSDEFWYKVNRREDLFSGEPYDGVVEVVNKCAKKYDVYYLTKRVDEITEVTLDFITKYGFPNPNKVFITQDSKGNFLENYKTDYYVEDRSDYLETMQNLTTLIGVRQPWNNEYYESNYNNGIIWINNILELPKVLEV